MSIPLTPRMQNWLEKLGAHIAVASCHGFPSVIVASGCKVKNSHIEIELTSTQVLLIQDDLLQNPYAALAPGGMGAVRAPYQIKGPARLSGHTMQIKVEEIYCTKPGDEAGARLDTLGYEAMQAFDQQRWPDIEPPQPKEES